MIEIKDTETLATITIDSQFIDWSKPAADSVESYLVPAWNQLRRIRESADKIRERIGMAR